ncbi:rod shape-determining protein MreC [Sphingosinicella sp.]|uniref:rod shape-determining protein MreC n=1 Tax=Sphingosinicella sp. TaxID=1917971 RepID=UPI004037D280
MAPPGKRRSGGHSRRAQYGLFLGYVFAIGGIVVAILMLILSRVDPRGFDAVKGAALDVTAPITAAGRGVAGFFTGIGDTIGNYWQAGSQNEALQAELAQTQRDLVAARAAEAENQRLLRLLGLARDTPDEIVVTRIVGSSFESSRRLATLAAGSSSGVAVGQPVRAPDGLVGRVIETGRWASRVLLVTDGASNVPVRLVRDGTPAIAAGRGDGTIELRTLEVGQNPFRPGDILLTSGTGGIFPPNIPVAMVVRLDGDTAIARPLADPARADFALVLRPYQPAANAPLDQAAAPAAGPPVAGPPPAAPPAPGRQNDPRYQPALQSPPPQGGAR